MSVDSKQSDQLIVEKIKAGDMEAFEMLVNKYKHYAYTLALRVLNDEMEAEEAAHDAFLKALDKIDQFKSESKFSTWFYKIVVNMAISRTRKKRLETKEIDDHTSNQASSISTSGQLEQKDRDYYLEKAVSMLKEDERLLISLYYLEELSMNEVQEITGYEMSNLKVKVFRARKKLAENLKKVLPKELESIL